MSKKYYYAVAVGRKPGIYNTWDEAKDQVSGFSYGRHQKFKTKEEAERFLKEAKAEFLKNDSVRAENKWHKDNVKPFNRSVKHTHKRIA